MEKSPLLANGYNHPPTHLGHMQYMQQFNHHHHHPAAAHAIMNPAGLSHPALPRPDAQLLKSQGLSMEALARWVSPGTLDHLPLNNPPEITSSTGNRVTITHSIFIYM